MPNTIDDIFGPLSKEYCVYFYFLSMLGFIMLVFFLVSGIIFGLTKKKGIEFYFTLVAASLGYAIFYFQNRLLHSMCQRTI